MAFAPLAVIYLTPVTAHALVMNNIRVCLVELREHAAEVAKQEVLQGDDLYAFEHRVSTQVLSDACMEVCTSGVQEQLQEFLTAQYRAMYDPHRTYSVQPIVALRLRSSPQITFEVGDDMLRSCITTMYHDKGLTLGAHDDVVEAATTLPLITLLKTRQTYYTFHDLYVDYYYEYWYRRRAKEDQARDMLIGFGWPHDVKQYAIRLLLSPNELAGCVSRWADA